MSNKQNNNKRFYAEDYLPSDEKDYFLQIMEAAEKAEEQKKKESEELDELVKEPTKKTSKKDDQESKESSNTDSEELKTKLYQYLKSQKKDIKNGLAEIAEEYDAVTINTCIDAVEYDDESWEKLLILEIWGK